MGGGPESQDGVDEEGKNAISATVSTFELIPMPNQTISSGAMATLGMVWVRMSSGKSTRSTVRNWVMSTAETSAEPTAMPNPIRISFMVTIEWLTRLPSRKPSTRETATAEGAGTRMLEMSNISTTTCQTTNSPMNTSTL